jgi:hypothetical protein
MARLDPAIQQAAEIFSSFMDGPIKPGHDNGGLAEGGRSLPDQGAGLRGVRRLAFVNSWDWDDPLEAGTPIGVLLDSRNPNCKSTPIGSAGPVKIGPVTLCRA